MIPSQYCDSPSKRALETCDIKNMSSSPSMGTRHLSKSTSELSSPREMPEVRPRSAAPPETSHLSVYQKAHSFFAQLKNRWGHSKSRDRDRERRHKSPGRQDSTDYAADLSSDHSTPSTQSPKHRIYARTDSPLSRACAGGDTTSSPSGSPRPKAPTPGAVAGLDLLPLSSNDEITRRRETALRQHSFFQLRVHLRRGNGLVAMDKSGTSDPYVKFKCGGRLIYKSRTVYRELNPIWDESFTVPVEDPFAPIHIKVFDYDWGLQDDFMGSAVLELTSLELGRPTDITLPLQDSAKPTAQLGEILLTATLYPKTQEDKEQIYQQPPKGMIRAKMLENKSTSRIRRKVKTKLMRISDKFQENLAASLDDITSKDKKEVKDHLKKLMKRSSTTDIDKSTFEATPPKNITEGFSSTMEKEKSSSNDELLSDDNSSDQDVSFEASKKAIVFYKRDFRNNPPKSIFEQDDPNLLEKITLKVKAKGDQMQRYFQKNARTTDVNRRLKSQIWSSVVTIVLVEGKNLLACDPETGTSDPYVKFRLGNEKYKSRIVWRSLNPRWLEQLDLHLYDDGDQQLEITVWDKDRSRDDFIGRCVIDLSQLERETTHSLWKELEDGAGSLHLLLTISGTTASETISDLTTYEENPREKEILLNRYAWHRTFHNLKDVGHLTVKVFRANGLAAADLGGKSDPFCVLELGNARLQTQTEYKTLTPSWQKIFTFNVKDINNVLEVTVFDEDRDHKVEFLGKIAIPLLRIRNGEKRWYALKDKKLRSRAKGNSPQILLEMNLVWNPIRACIRTLNPKEEKYMQTEVKFKRQVFVKNVLRMKVFAMHFYEFGKLFQSCFEWESKLQSFIALIFWLIFCYYFQPWMVPALILLVFLKQYIVRLLAGPIQVPWDEIADSDLEDDDDDDKEKEEKKSLKERLQAIQEVTQSVQNTIGRIATLLESVKNTFNFTVPYLSWIAVGLLVLTCTVLYLIPVRYLLMLWGLNKFFRRLLRPHTVPNNELLDLLSRVPDDEMLMWAKLVAMALSNNVSRYTVMQYFQNFQLDYKDLKILVGNENERRRDQRKKHKTS